MDTLQLRTRPSAAYQSGKVPVLLAVLAHPDDETFGMGGTLALYSRRGVEVHLACATRGEVGEVEPEMLQGHPSIAELREGELRCAAGLLGLTGVHFMNYRDSGMPGSPDNFHPGALVAQPLDNVAGDVAHLIRKLHPQVVITFDPIGGYRHPDHIHIQKATVLGFSLAGDPKFLDPDGLPPYSPQKLYFHTMSRKFLRLAVRILPIFGRNPSKFGKNGDIDLTSLIEEDFPVHAEVDFTPVAKIRDEAAACHASQGGKDMSRGIQGLIFKLFRRSETFMQAYPEPANGKKKEKDLFAGVQLQDRVIPG